MEPEGEIEEDFGESVLPEDVQEVAVPMPLITIEAWHRPRKQFIRERQWRYCAELLLDKLVRAGAPSIRAGKLNYLTLPGIDYFDVEMIGDLAADRGLGLEAMGFLADLDRDPVRARSQFRSDALIKKGLILDTSVTYPYRFEELSSKNSQAYRSAKSRAPFNIINIDACGSIALPREEKSARIITALFSLVELQFSTMRDPWLLYLTTDVRDESLSHDVRAALDGAIRQNAEQSDEFREGFVQCVGSAGDDLEAALTMAEDVPGKFVTKFSLGFAKWLIHNAEQQHWGVKCRPFFCYSTRADGDDGASMPCLAFEFRPEGVNMRDVHGAVNLPARAEPAPPEYSMEALRKARDMVNVDALLEGDASLRREYAAKQRRMLQGAGYRAEALAAFDLEFLA